MPSRRNDDTRAPESRVVIRDFPGFVSNVDPDSLPPGVARRQVNATSWRPGELRVRPGYSVVQFDTQ